MVGPNQFTQSLKYFTSITLQSSARNDPFYYIQAKRKTQSPICFSTPGIFVELPNDPVYLRIPAGTQISKQLTVPPANKP